MTHSKRTFFYKFLLRVAACFFMFGISYSQNNIIFDHLTTNDGLSQSDINCIYQDEDGFMWFGTYDGLNKYNGYEFINYLPDANNEESISSNIIFDITGDKSGNLWIGTTGGGLNRFNKKTKKFTRYLHDVNDDNTLDSNIINSVYVDDKNNRLWVGTKKGVNLLDLSTSQNNPVFVKINSKESVNVNDIYQDIYGNVWVGANSDLYVVIEDEDNQFNFIKINYDFNLINQIGENQNGELIIATNTGMFIKKNVNGSDEIIQLTHTNTRAFIVDENNNYWVGNNKGLSQNRIVNEKDLKKKNHFEYDPINLNSISKNIVNSIYEDRTGILWIGTNGGGVNKIDPNRKQFQHINKTSDSNSLSYDKIRAFYEDSNNDLWVGTEGGGLNLLNSKNGNRRFNNFKKFNDLSKIFALEEVVVNNRKTLLIGTGNKPGLFKLDIDKANKNSNQNIDLFVNTMGSVFTILQDNNKNIWLGTYGGGVYRLIPQKNSNAYKVDVFEHIQNNKSSIPSNIIRNIYQDSKGNIWFGTAKGLSKLTSKELLKDNPKFEVYRNIPTDSTSLSHNYILPIYESKEGDIYVGTFGGGLNKYVPGNGKNNDQFVRYYQKDGLANEVIKSILEDDLGNLWLSTNKGLSKFDTKTQSFKNYDVNDGLQNNEFQELAGLKRSDGSLLFGGINGFNVFFPEEINENVFPAQTVVTSFSVFNNKINPGEAYNGKVLIDSSINYINNINLKYDQNSFTIEFAGLHYAASLKNKFSYILEGYDKDWIQTSSEKRFANYTNISHGNYTFKVKASNGDGVWDASPKVINLHIAPPFWKTYPAYIFYALLAFGLLFAFRKFTIIKTTRKHQLELEHIEKEKQEEIQVAKLEFFTNISHEFRTPLTLIKGPLDYLMNAESTQKSPETKEQFSIMSKNTDYLMRLVNQLLDFRKINQGKMRLVMRHTDIIAFVKEVGEPFQFTSHKQNIDFNISSIHKSMKVWFDHDALEKIIKNLLSNAFKFTSAHGKINVVISKESVSNASDPGYVIIEVENTGSGISEEEIKSVFNRFYTKNNNKHNPQNGAGIGLSFTQSLIKFHQGRIDVKSTPNHSTSFMVKLPLDKNVYKNIPEISIKDKTESDFLTRTSENESFAIDMNDEITDANIVKKQSKKPLVLVVDDNDDIRTFIRLALSDTFNIVEASNGEEGLRIANDFIPSIVLTDVVMPVMDGIELCNTLKSQTETSHIPIIMLTAKTSNESEVSGLKTGADGYVKKPFDINILKLKLNNILKDREELRKKFNREITLQPEDVTVTSLDEKFLQQAIEIVEKHMMNTDFNVELLVKEIGLSRSNLYIKLKDLTGLSSSAFIRNIRLKRAVQLLEQSDNSVKEIMYMTGFNTSSYFSKCFRKQFGSLPSEYVKQIKRNKTTFVK
ncbi:two-component regulator propeller domain-containing protein [Flavivirga abyssicola]|uniref:hybrid sensor histidine kinase/response regulator transcription factor n=1 Tax=Flavivirga abyssicola TaxID=3063533 RepID=UPI0026DEBA2F|nr:two-component regulator propeller domain-containing protein [Flavivirga sp. MEBiC07777]WVK13797.1 two-component regulator propeller domain-containing protein [Flavivirga sp. MEBiC07777]